jgi:hypothetical protein
MLSKLNLIQLEMVRHAHNCLNYKVLMNTNGIRFHFQDSEMERLMQATICIREAPGSRFDGEIG